MDIYRVGVSIALTNSIAPALATISRNLLGIHATTRGIENSFGRWAVAIGGVASVLGGVAIAKGLVKIAEHGTKLLDQQSQMRNLGISQNEVLKVTSDYYTKINRQIPTATAAEFLKTTKELRAITGNTADAARLAPKALQVDALLANTFGTKTDGEYYKLLRATEMKGVATDDKKREAFVDDAFKYILSFGGKLTARDYQTMARRGGAAFINMKPESMGPLSVLAADLGGESAGTTMMTFHQLMTGANTMSKQQAAVWKELGLLDESKTSKTGFGGGRLQLGIGAIKGAQEYNGDQPGWIKEVLYPAIVKASTDNEGKVDHAKVESYISKMAPNRNASKMIHMFGEEGFQDQIKKDMGIAGMVKPIPEAYKEFIGNNPKGVRQAFDSQYESMMQAIGSPLMQAAIPVMKSVTEIFQKIGEFANTNPEAIKAIGVMFGALAVGLVAIGGVALATLLGVPAAITAVVAALAGLVVYNWDAVKAGVQVMQDAANAFQAAMQGMAKAVWDFIKSLPGKIGGLFTNPQNVPGMGMGPDMDDIKKKMNFNPNEIRMKAQPITLALNVDGRALAQTVSQEIDYLHEHPTSAPSYDNTSRFGPADGGIISG